MTNKHLACVLLGIVIVGLAYFTNNMKTKMSLMQEEASNAERLANDAETARAISDQGLRNLKKSSEPIRAFLAEWTPHLDKFETADDGSKAIRTTISDRKMIPLKQGARSMPSGSKGGYIQTKLSSDMRFEDDYLKCLDFLGVLESELPASRIAHCKLTKGQGSNNSINMEVIVELPMPVATK